MRVMKMYGTLSIEAFEQTKRNKSEEREKRGGGERKGERERKGGGEEDREVVRGAGERCSEESL